MAPHLKDAGVDRWVRDRPHASDHAPTWISVDLKVQKQPATQKAAADKPAAKKAAAKKTAAKTPAARPRRAKPAG
jgi:exodeoxyribonuclease-3